MLRIFFISPLITLLFLVNSTLYAKEYTNTSFYVAYDNANNTQFALILPSVNKIYTHQAGHILPTDLKQVDTQFSSFPTYNNGQLCFSALTGGASGADGALKMAGNCYTVNFFYTQKEAAPNGKIAFILTYVPTDTVYEGLAGDSTSFKIVKIGSNISNQNSITNDDYSHFTFDIATTTVTMLGNTAPIANSQNVVSNEDSAKNITLTASDVDGDALTYSIISSPSHGTLSGTSPNITYTPTVNYNGTDSFTFKVNDGDLDSSTVTVNITINPVADVPVADGQTLTSSLDVPLSIILTGTDADSEPLTYTIVTNPNHGTLSGTAPNVTYTPTASYYGADSFTFTVNDGMADSAVATVSITVNKDPNVIYITEDYEVHQLGKGTSIEKRVQIDTVAKSLYILLSNYSPTVSDSVSIMHNAKYFSAKKMSSLSNISEVKKNIIIMPTPGYIRNFEHSMKDILIPNTKKSKVQFKTLTTEQSNKDIAGTSTQVFYLDTSSAGANTTATARKVISNINTDKGIKSLNVWVSDDSFDSGSGCSKSKCITQTMIDSLADSFLKEGTDNDIYDWVTNIFGLEWGSDASIKFSNLITKNDEITILLTDIGDDNSINGGTLGYFYSKDNFKKSSVSGSNERIMFYIDSVLFAKEDDGQAWSLNSFWPKEMISTLAHEFQHMIHYYQKSILLEVDTEVWLNEMLSETTEDMVATKIQHAGPRGVAYTDGSAGSTGNTEGRYPLFNENNTLSLTDWQNSLKDYSKVNAFGTFLTRNYGGAKVLHDIVHNSFANESAIVDAVNKIPQDVDKTFDDLLREWGVAVLLSSNDNIQTQPTYNVGDFIPDSYGNSTYELGSINFFNYNPLPTIATVAGTVNPQANYYYKIGDNITGAVDINITLSGTTEATLIVK